MTYSWIGLGIYIVGFILVFVFNASIGPVTPGIAFLRALIWPIWIATGWPQGEVQGFD